MCPGFFVSRRVTTRTQQRADTFALLLGQRWPASEHFFDVVGESFGAQVAAGFLELGIVGWAFTSANIAGY